MTERNTSDVSSEQEPIEMSRAEALAILGLPETANAYAVDNRFWQLTKRYRAEKNEEELRRVTDAYDIASGRAARRTAEEKEILISRKFLGKTSKQWKVYWYYTWWKYLLTAVLVTVILLLGYQILFKKDYDIKIVSLGHFATDSTVLENFSKEKMGYVNPYVVSADVVTSNTEGQNNASVYGATAASAYLTINPNLMFFDEETMPYYLTYLVNLDDYYEDLKQALPTSLYEKIEPVRASMKDYYLLTAEDGETPTYTAEDEVEHIYGLRITDPKIYQALGYISQWSDGRESLVFSINSSSKQISASEDFLLALIKDQKEIIAQFEKTNGSIVLPSETSSVVVSMQEEETDKAA